MIHTKIISFDRPYIESQIKLIKIILSELINFSSTSKCVELSEHEIYGHIEKIFSTAQIESHINDLVVSKCINTYKIVDYGEKNTPTEIVKSNTYLLDVNERTLINYLHSLEVKLNYNESGEYQFKYGIKINLEKGTFVHKNKTYRLQVGKAGIQLLLLLLEKFPNILPTTEILAHFNLNREEMARVYEIRDELKSILINKFGLTEKIANKFYENVRGVGYKIALNTATIRK